MQLTAQEIFNMDLNKFNKQFIDMDAVIMENGAPIGIDPTRAPVALMDAYSNLVSYGYANGLIR